MNDFIGSIWKQNCGDELKVLEKTNIKRGHSYIYKCLSLIFNNYLYAHKHHIINGRVMNLLCPDKYGFVLGIGRFSETNTPYIYNLWNHLKLRCKKENYNNSIYNKIEISKEFYNLQVFGEWFENNAYEDNLSIDKDILCNIKHLETKIYSPDTCLLIPVDLNCFLAGDNCKVGVNIYRSRYFSKLSNNKRYFNLGTFDTFKEAKLAYAKKKYEIWIEEINKYKIPNYLKETLLKYDFSWSWIWENMTEEEIREKYYGSIER